jgi:elongation factor 3
MPAPAKKHETANVAVPTPVKIAPAQLALEGSHAAAAEEAGNPQGEAKVDIHALLTSTDAETRATAADELTNLVSEKFDGVHASATAHRLTRAYLHQVKMEGPTAFVRLGLADAIQKGLNDKKSAVAREGACALITTLCQQGVGQAIEPFMFEKVLPLIVSETFADKEKNVRAAAVEAIHTFAKTMSPWAVPEVLPILLEQIKTAGKWQVKTGALEIMDVLVKHAPEQMARACPTIIPVMTDAIWDTKADVKKAARATLKQTTSLVTNKDIERFIPALLKSLENPVEETVKTIQLLGATTFVSEVDSPTLSLMVPLLSRGLDERATAVRRKVAVIVDNMSKLVDNEHTVRPFLPSLLPKLIKIEDTVADPEARGVVTKCIKTLREVGNVQTGDGSDLPPAKVYTAKDLSQSVLDACKAVSQTHMTTESPLVHYIATLSANLLNARNYEVTEWETVLCPYVNLGVPEAAKAQPIVRDILEKSAKETGAEVEVFEDEEEGEDLCNCQFSLAYGAKILLNTATLRLKRGHRYGLCGRNGSGKSTLMRAIHNGQVEGFPSPDEVRTFYVEHDIDGSEEETTVLEFILADKRILGTDDEIKETLNAVGFTAERQGHSIGSLSGGWKMKLALARAILFKADILLLDEPTNHLDVLNVTWLIDYLTSLTQTTSIIVSHDSDFLNRTVTDILHLDRFKIKRYPGNLEAFVKHVPAAKAYYELNPAEDYQFKFPDPPLLEGVKTKEKSLLKMRHVTFQYPGSAKPQLFDITLQVSLSSRVAVLGPNGAGKSTLVKLLVGETESQQGEVWKHPNLVIGYVAQHAFHHIDHHLDKTPLEYLLWRYQTGEDLEELTKETRVITAAEEEKMKQGSVVVIEGVKRLIDEIVGRKKLKQSYEYEVSFKAMSSSENIWMSRDELISRGFEKKVLEVDTREAQRLGLLRPLVRKEIEKHMADFGLEAEFVTHNSMRGLSGGQKVKVVLAAATWRRPHVVILDEPTNYLDRESLAALIESLKSFEGGVLVITHNREFSESLCKEVWAMSDGHLIPSGHNWVEGQGSGPRIDGKKDDEEEHFDAMGNKIDGPKKVKKLTSKEERKKKKDRIAKKKAGTYDSADELEDL